MKKLLVTGGLGFIGSYFVDLALKRGYYVINVDKKTYAARTDIDFDKRRHYQFIEEDCRGVACGQLDPCQRGVLQQQYRRRL
jgi:dTDP-glucose 4,6-dehydratase